MDLHIHSQHSFDSKASPQDILAEAKRKGLHIIGVTDHGTRKGALEIKKLAKGIQVLVGQEVKTEQGDILVFNIDQDLEQGLDVEKTCRQAKELGGFIIIPHPFDPLRQVTGKATEKIVKYVDCIEGFNAKCFFGWSNKKAQEFAASRRLPAIASSDAHRPEEVGSAFTLVEGDDVFQSIKEGRISMVTSSVDKKTLMKKRVKKVFGRK